MKVFAGLVVLALASVALASDENGKDKEKGHFFKMLKMQTCIDFQKAKESVASVGGDCAKLTEGPDHTSSQEPSQVPQERSSSEEHHGGPGDNHDGHGHHHGGDGHHHGGDGHHHGGHGHEHGGHHGHGGPNEWFEKMEKAYECFVTANNLRDADNATIIENVKAAISEFAQSEEKAQALSALIDGCNEAKAPTISAADRPNFMECVLEAAMEQNTCMPEMLTTTSAPAEA